jgi:hypothetical protein
MDLDTTEAYVYRAKRAMDRGDLAAAIAYLQTAQARRRKAAEDDAAARIDAVLADQAAALAGDVVPVALVDVPMRDEQPRELPPAGEDCPLCPHWSPTHAEAVDHSETYHGLPYVR